MEKKIDNEQKVDKEEIIAQLNYLRGERVKEIAKKLKVDKREISRSRTSRSNRNASVDFVSESNEVIEDMVIMGDVVRDQILEERRTNPKRFISTEEALSTKNERDPNFIMGILARNLEDRGMTVGIENDSDTSTEAQEQASTTLQFLCNGMLEKKKFELHFDFGEERNLELLSREDEQKKYNDLLRKKLANDFNLKEEDIIITNVKSGSYCVSVVFKSLDFNDLTKDQLIAKFKDNENIKEKEEGLSLGALKDIHEDFINSGWKLSKNMFDIRGNQDDSGWGRGEKRGRHPLTNQRLPYNPPEGWIGYGLNVYGKYDNGNNDWLSYDGRDGEWAIAYHGIARNQDSDSVKKVTGLIANTNLKPGSAQAYEDDTDAFSSNPNATVGKGVYISPNPKVLEQYAGTVNVDNRKYLVGFMLRVNPKMAHQAQSYPDYWVVTNGTDNEIRPYRILLKPL